MGGTRELWSVLEGGTGVQVGHSKSPLLSAGGRVQSPQLATSLPYLLSAQVSNAQIQPAVATTPTYISMHRIKDLCVPL